MAQCLRCIALHGELQPKDFVNIGWNAALKHQWQPIETAPKDGMIRVTKHQADRCQTHHAACDCREYRAQEMERAIESIYNMALTWKDSPCELDSMANHMRIIREECKIILKDGAHA